MAHEKEAILTDNAPAPVGPYSQAVRYGDLVFISGQIPIDPATGNIPEGIEDQAEQVCRNVLAIAKEAMKRTDGAALPAFLKTTIYLTDMGNFPVVNGIYEGYFGGDVPPARACAEVSSLPKGVRIMIEAIAGL